MRTIILIGAWDATLFWWDWNSGSQGAIDEAMLPISAESRRQLDEWYRMYSEIYHEDHTIPNQEMEERLLDEKGFELWKRLRNELSGVYEVLFFSQRLGKPFTTPEEFDSERRRPYA
jgi:hypothetical protein